MMAQLITKALLLCLTPVLPKYVIKIIHLSLVKAAVLRDAEDYWSWKETDSAGAS